MRLNGALEEVLRVVESFYNNNGASREELYERRTQAWELYLALVASIALIRRWADHQVALRACLLVFITRMALERQSPMLLAEWYAIGNGGDSDGRSLHGKGRITDLMMMLKVRS